MTDRDRQVSAMLDTLGQSDHDDLCCLADDCNAPVVFELRANCKEPYCEVHGPAMVVTLIAMTSTTPNHIDLVRLAPRKVARTLVAA